ncbi:MAG: hypothetical protein R3B96_11160 [Pirellulaceae bacterium]
MIDKNDTEGLNAWPNIFRAARFTSAVEYVQLMRVRSLLMEQMAELMRGVDLYISQTGRWLFEPLWLSLDRHSYRCGQARRSSSHANHRRALTGQLFEDDRLRRRRDRPAGPGTRGILASVGRTTGRTRYPVARHRRDHESSRRDLAARLVRGAASFFSLGN